MRRRREVAATTFICFATLAVFAQRSTKPWHTSPDKWNEPRTFHSPFNEGIDERISLAHEKLSGIERSKTLSPNKAYWFSVDTAQAPSRQTNGNRFPASAADASIYIFNERGRLTRITFRDYYPNFAPDVRWINEKLLYIEVWWGRVVGSSFIFDVEHEKFVHKETVHDGQIPFQQFREAQERKLLP